MCKQLILSQEYISQNVNGCRLLHITNSLEIIKSTVAVAQLPCRLNWAATLYATRNRNETEASKLTLNSVFFCPAEILCHVILWHQCSCSIDKQGQGETDGCTVLATPLQWLVCGILLCCHRWSFKQQTMKLSTFPHPRIPLIPYMSVQQ